MATSPVLAVAGGVIAVGTEFGGLLSYPYPPSGSAWGTSTWSTSNPNSGQTVGAYGTEQLTAAGDGGDLIAAAGEFRRDALFEPER